MAAAIQSLPFVRDATQEERSQGLPNRVYWEVEPTGDYTKDCDVGMNYARLALDYMRRENFDPLLNWIVTAMMRKGAAPSGVEIGFLQVVAQCATVGAGRMV